MRDFLNRSFRTKLLVSFLLIGMVPLLLCTVLMLGIFQSSLHRSVADTAQTQLDALCGDLDGLLDACAQVMDRLRSSGRVRSALDSGPTDMAQDIYSILYDTASPLLNDAAFSLLDAGGSRLYATASLSGGGCLSVDWGLLKAARRSPDIVYRDVDDFGQGGAGSLLQAACAVREGERVVGYVVLDLTQRHFERLFEKRTGSAGGVLVLDAFWDEVYASASLRDAGLAPVLRERLRTQRPVPWEQLPDFSLYMDQVLSYMDRQVIRFDEDDGLTAAMVNNYTKSGLVPRAEGKKYNRDHLAYLTAICVLKRVMSTRDMDLLIREELQGDRPISDGYAAFCGSLNKALNAVADEMEDRTGEEELADAAIHFALMSYAAGVASSRYVTLLRQRQEAREEAASAAHAKSKERAKKEKEKD